MTASAPMINWAKTMPLAGSDAVNSLRSPIWAAISGEVRHAQGRSDAPGAQGGKPDHDHDRGKDQDQGGGQGRELDELAAQDAREGQFPVSRGAGCGRTGSGHGFGAHFRPCFPVALAASSFPKWEWYSTSSWVSDM